MRSLKQKLLKLIKYSVLISGFFLVFSYALAQDFNIDLKLGFKNDSVKTLQQYLNSQGFVVALSGPGSPGNETPIFGSLTKQALIKFQEYYSNEILKPLGLNRGTGNFFASTRNFINLQASQGIPLKFNSVPAVIPVSTTTPVQKIIYTGGYASGGGGGSVSVVTQSPVINFNNIVKTYGDGSFVLQPVSDSPGSFSFTSGDTNIASVSSNSVSIIGAGTTTITALQNASGNYSSGSASATLTINKKAPTVTWSNFTMPFLSLSAASNANPFPLTLDSSPVSDSPGTFYLASGDPSMFSVNASTGIISALQNIDASVTPSVTLTIGQNASANYNATSVTATITLTKPNLCLPTNPCQYGGSCSVGFGGQTYNGFTCTCANNMTGKTCNVATDQCAPHPCNNGGTCTRTSTLGLGAPLNSYTCSCPSGYSGATCDLSSYACDGSQGQSCYNGGTCQPDAFGGNCSCVYPFEGTYCQNISGNAAAYKNSEVRFASVRYPVSTFACYLN